ncbi:MAG: hypothetical protein ACRD12_13115 [Acidimicrobiales bacterium]
MGDAEQALADVVAQRDALEQKVVTLENRMRWRARFRRWGAAFLVVLTCISFTAATTGVWAKRNFLNTEVFVERVGPLVHEVEMQEAISRILSDSAVEVIDPRRLVSEALPERGQILVGPISGAVESFIRNRVENFVASDQFDRLWLATVEKAHRSAVAVLEGKRSDFASTANGEVSLNLVPIINAVLAEIGKFSPDILGHNIQLPTLTVDEAPDAAVRRLEGALGVNLKDGYGQVTVFKSDELSSVQNAVELFDKGTILLVLATLVLLPLTLWVSPRWRRTLLQLCAGIAIGMVLVRRASFFVESDVLDLVKKPANEGAVQLLLTTFLAPLRTFALWVLAALAAVAAIAFITGPYPWMVRVRRGVRANTERAASLVGKGARSVADPRAATWLQAYKDKVRIGEAAVLLLALLFLNLSWLVIFVLFAIVAAIEVVMMRALPEPEPEQPEEPGPTAEPEPTVAKEG